MPGELGLCDRINEQGGKTIQNADIESFKGRFRHECLAADESAAIEDLAHHVGSALDVFGHSASSDDSVLAKLRAMHRSIADGFSLLRAKLERG